MFLSSSFHPNHLDHPLLRLHFARCSSVPSCQCPRNPHTTPFTITMANFKLFVLGFIALFITHVFAVANRAGAPGSCSNRSFLKRRDHPVTVCCDKDCEDCFDYTCGGGGGCGDFINVSLISLLNSLSRLASNTSCLALELLPSQQHR